jgi:hypothetical protein
MHELCRHCQYLLAEVYSFIYKSKKGNVEFVLTPMPRLEVETIGDFKVLFEIGALTPDMSLELSKLLLGSAARPKSMRENKMKGQKNEESNALPKGSNDSMLGAMKKQGGEESGRRPENAKRV